MTFLGRILGKLLNADPPLPPIEDDPAWAISGPAARGAPWKWNYRPRPHLNARRPYRPAVCSGKKTPPAWFAALRLKTARHDRPGRAISGASR